MSVREIIGNTTATPNPQADWGQRDNIKPDYIRNKPILGTLSAKDTVSKTDLAGDVQESLNKANTAIQSIDGLATETYVGEQIAKIPTPDVSGQISTHDNSTTAHNDIRAAIPTKVGQLTNDKGYLTEHQSLAGYAKTADLGDLAMKDTVAKTDLASDVQTSLGKADTALQSFTETDPTVPAWAKASTKPTYTKSEVGLGNVDNIKQYSASNPPPYPVTKVNNKTGAVTLSASDVGALPSTTKIPTKVSDLTNDSGFITSVPDEIYVGNGEMPETATIQILMDGSDEEQALKDELVEYIDGEIADELAKRGQSSPQFANDVSECTDTSKLYVLPDGNIWAHSKGITENKVNQYNSDTAKLNYRVHPDYIGTSNDPWRVCKGLVFVEIDGLDFTNKSSYIIRFNGVTPVRHSAMGITGQVVFLNQPSSAPWDFTGYASSKYLDTAGAFVIQQDASGYFVDLMDASPATNVTRCYFGICLADNTNISATDCENLFIECVPLTTYTTEYSWRDTGLAYANYVLTDNDTTIIAEKVDKKINAVMYVDGETGNDANTGSQDSPLKTIQKAIDSGAKTIYCKAGTYNENITLNNAHGVKIIGQWETYENGKRPKARIDHSTTLIPSDNGNGLKTIALSADLYKYEHPLLYQVFVTKTVQPTIGSGINIGYVVSLWNVTDEQISSHYKLVPVMTLAECQSTEETFFYDGTTIYIHSTGSTFRMVSVDKRNKVENCSDIVFEDIAFDYCYYDALTVNNSNGVIFRNCEFSHSSTVNGVATVNMNGEFYNCEAYCNRNDGFNLHGFGETTIYNCIGAYNYDDGISHHDGCTGSIHGGQYYHNGKGGISSPTYGAVIDIYNAIMFNNQYGIYAYGGTADRQIIVNGCYIHHNTYGIGSSYELLAIHSTITDNSTNTSGNVTVVQP